MLTLVARPWCHGGPEIYWADGGTRWRCDRCGNLWLHLRLSGGRRAVWRYEPAAGCNVVALPGGVEHVIVLAAGYASRGAATWITPGDQAVAAWGYARQLGTLHGGVTVVAPPVFGVPEFEVGVRGSAVVAAVARDLPRAWGIDGWRKAAGPIALAGGVADAAAVEEALSRLCPVRPGEPERACPACRR